MTPELEGQERGGVVSQRHVLIVEDDRDLRELLAELLRSEGYTVNAVANGAEALLYLAVRPDLVLLDLGMPVLDGYTFLKELRETQYGDTPAVLVVSGAPDRRALADLGPLRFLGKPLQADRLLDEVKALVGPAVPA